MVISAPEQINEEWAVELGLKSVEFRVFARACQLIARESHTLYGGFVLPYRLQTVFAESLARSAQAAQGKQLVPVAVDDLEAVGGRLQGPWDPVFILQQPDVTPELLPDFMEISGAMGASLLKHTTELQDARPEIFNVSSRR